VTTASGSVSRQFVGSAVTGLWLGAAGSAAFAIVTLIASLASNVRRRVREVGVLRALGMAARDQARMRRTEIVVVLVFALVVGIVVGVAMLTLTVGTLARSSTPEAPAVLPLTLRFEFLTPLALVGAIAILSIVVVWRYLSVVAATAKAARP
jgi:putative ABC transport system permease protein